MNRIQNRTATLWKLSTLLVAQAMVVGCVQGAEDVGDSVGAADILGNDFHSLDSFDVACNGSARTFTLRAPLANVYDRNRSWEIRVDASASSGIVPGNTATIRARTSHFTHEVIAGIALGVQRPQMWIASGGGFEPYTTIVRAGARQEQCSDESSPPVVCSSAFSATASNLEPGHYTVIVRAPWGGGSGDITVSCSLD